ncbi:hypothetical protein TSUD_398340 [Trifolium subterraneum]|uniref:Uncharacterized protein n=1 Tax=Trifolium subterraneum TaxID=3900 RepID=A0A2Z6NCW5_TRISU|nr:hypothetical protein TSUD_398340 [Trifolium subterraneum]
MPSGSNKMENRYNTFLQLMCQLPRGTKLSVLVLSDQHEAFETEPTASSVTRTGGSTAIMLESELDGFTKLGGWVEMNTLNPKSVQWAVTLSDVPEDSFGWGMKPGFTYATDGNSGIAGIATKHDFGILKRNPNMYHVLFGTLWKSESLHSERVQKLKRDQKLNMFRSSNRIRMSARVQKLREVQKLRDVQMPTRVQKLSASLELFRR